MGVRETRPLVPEDGAYNRGHLDRNRTGTFSLLSTEPNWLGQKVTLRRSSACSAKRPSALPGSWGREPRCPWTVQSAVMHVHLTLGTVMTYRCPRSATPAAEGCPGLTHVLGSPSHMLPGSQPLRCIHCFLHQLPRAGSCPHWKGQGPRPLAAGPKRGLCPHRNAES